MRGIEELATAQNPDLRASYAAMKRAAQAARQIAIQTNTGIVRVENGKPVYIPAAQLIQEEIMRRAAPRKNDEQD